MTKLTYDSPELGLWKPIIDSHKLSELAEWCATTARNQSMLIPEQRHLLAGMRAVLRKIAEMKGIELP